MVGLSAWLGILRPGVHFRNTDGRSLDTTAALGSPRRFLLVGSDGIRGLP